VTRSTRNYGIERLESRQLLAATAVMRPGGILYIVADPGGSFIQVGFTPTGRVSVRNAIGQSEVGSFRGKRVMVVQFDGSAADDSISVSAFGGPAFSKRLVAAGYAGADTLSGAVASDVLFGGAGNDELRGADGDDVLFGGAGNDVVLGGGGNDLIDGGLDNDDLSGEDGDDVIYAHAGADAANGGAGDDVVRIGNSNLFSDGGDGSDSLFQVAGTSVNSANYEGTRSITLGSARRSLQRGVEVAIAQFALKRTLVRLI
jgi:Ca2+-binding RTX toxin-like protein